MAIWSAGGQRAEQGLHSLRICLPNCTRVSCTANCGGFPAAARCSAATENGGRKSGRGRGSGIAMPPLRRLTAHQLERYLDQTTGQQRLDFVQSVRELIVAHLPTGNCTVKRIAIHLG